ncbi:non-ribosomal peptide synthetase [Nitrospira japonica]|uniref:non-ribosomal peptide synthetase n=1 Tax=Nitrospira japonica TaxID=1325564 RepID=UPI001560A072|nr:non-ribosomal peptide synthetase [Nitrospira japonica]
MAAVLILLSQYLGTDEVSLTVIAQGADGHACPRIVRVDCPGSRKTSDLVQDVRIQLAADANMPSHDSMLPCAVILDTNYVVNTFSGVLAFEFCSDKPSGWLSLHHRSGAFARWLVHQLAHHLTRVIASCLSNPTLPLARARLLEDSEAAAMMANGTGPRREYPTNVTLLRLFDNQVFTAPDQIIVIDPCDANGPSGVSNRVLDGRVRSLTGRLAALGVGVAMPVVVYVRRSVDALVTFLAIQRLGAAYVPLDHSYPTEYLRLIVDDTRAPVVITDHALDPSVVPPTTHLIAVSDDAGERPVIAEHIGTTTPCLIMYTSGSTGRPKGVVHCQRQLINRLHWMWETYPFSDGDVLAQRSSISVMPSMWELLGGVLAGIPTVIVPDAVLRDPVDFAAFLAQHRVSFITLTPTLLNLLLDARERAPAWPDRLRIVIIGGEPLTNALLRRFHAIFPRTLLVNDFGATEVNTILHTAFPPTEHGVEHGRGFRPIANVTTVILDPYMRPVPFGVEGELCVAGAPVALEYLNRPDLTVERFVEASPSDGAMPSRFYRTGDMGYMLPDGIYITGRRDHQVKVNGMRLELGGVERVLSDHPSVGECAVIHRALPDRTCLEAYVVGRKGHTRSAVDLRAFLLKRLPSHMVPQRIAWTESLPRRPNGKLDRIALCASPPTEPVRTPAGPDGPERIRALVREVAASVVGVDASAIRCDVELVLLGFDSIATIDFARRLSDKLQRPISAVMVYDYPTLDALLSQLCGTPEPAVARAAPVVKDHDSIAIVGISGRFPGANDIHQFWGNLCAGIESISTQTYGRWNPEAVYDPDPARDRRSYSKWGGFLAGADKFDPEFFGLSPAEARAMDPQQRLCLMESWRALEDSGCAGPGLEHQTVGVYVGARASDYAALISASGGAPDANTLLGNDMSLLAARISYFNNLRGPSVVVDTACSSSLVAVHLACRSLIAGECTVSLAGGVCVTNDPSFYVATSKLGVFSPTGHCRAFDEAADGFVHGEGVAFIVLKRLNDALADGDHIRAIIRGTAVNQDGRSNGIVAPNGRAQSELQTSLYHRLGIDPATIGFIEAHGTGTRLGDSIEVEALMRTFRRFTSRRQFCAIGSVKTNIGHLTAAAGIAGLIKATLCLYHRQFVPSLHFHRPNPLLNLADSPFFVATAHTAWNADKGLLRRAAVNAFGIGGTNAHCVLEESPHPPNPDLPKGGSWVFPMTAATPAAARHLVVAFLRWIDEAGRGATLRDISYSLLSGRKLFPHGYVFVARSQEELRSLARHALEADGSCGLRAVTPSPTAATAGPPLAFDPAVMSFEKACRIADTITRGVDDEWRELFAGGTSRRIPLPTYPFAQERFWIDAPQDAVPNNGSPCEGRADPCRTIANAVAQVLGVDDASVSSGRSLRDYGFDSVRSITLKLSLERTLGFSVPLELLLGDCSIADLSARLFENTIAADAHPRWVESGEPNRPFPLTELQAAYFVARRIPDYAGVGAHTYLEFYVERLDLERLESAWRRLVALHPMLRAVIDRDGTQRVLAELPDFDFVRYDVQGDRARLDEHLAKVRREMSHRVYQIAEWPLFDIRITTGAAGPARVDVSMDSWIVDGPSASLLFRQWRMLYEGREIQPPRATFRDFVMTMKQFEGSAAHRRSLEYWKKRLRELPPHPRLPSRRHYAGRPVNATDERRRLHALVPTAVWQRIKAALVNAKVSPSVGLLGLFAEQVRDAGWGDRFSLVLTLDGRLALHPDIDEVVGPFTSTSIFIVDDHADLSLPERLRRYQRQLWQDLNHRYVGGVAALRDATREMQQRLNVVFSSTLWSGAQSADAPTWLSTADFEVSQTPGVDLHMQAYERAEGLHLAWDVAIDRLELGDIQPVFDGLTRRTLQLGDATEAAWEADAEVLAQRRELIGWATTTGEQDAPLTPLQQSYVAHRLMHPAEPLATVYREFELVSFDAMRLQRAIDVVIRNSSTLRSVLQPDRGRLVEFPIVSYPVRVEDLRGLDPEAIRSRLNSVRAEMENSLRRGRWPRFAVRAWQVESDVARLQVLLDSVAFDGYSVGLFYDQLFRGYYDEDETGTPSSAFRHYATARARYIETAAYQADRRYWANKLATIPSGPTWPWPRPPDSSPSLRLEFTFDRWDALRQKAHARGRNPATVLLATYAEALRRATNDDAFTIVVVDYHQREAFPSLKADYGDCSTVSWLPWSAATRSFEQRLSDLENELRRDNLHGWGNPFEALRAGGSAADLGRRFPAAFTDCLNVPVLNHPQVSECIAYSSTPGIDIDHVVVRSGNGVKSTWQISQNLMTAAEAARILEQYQRILAELAVDESAWKRAASELAPPPPALLAPALLPEAWNQTDADYDRTQCIHRLFEQRASEAPDRVALIAADGELTYGQLERRANQLMHFLRTQQIGRGALVGLLMERSLDTVVTLLAILKSGAAYVPLSLSDPPVRIASIIQQSGLSLVVTQTRYASLVGASRTICLDAQASAIARESVVPFTGTRTRADDVAYVIFTSGSTGQPKGVVVQHRPVVNLIGWVHKTFGFGPIDRVLFVNSLAFDLSVFDIFGMLACGGSIHIADDSERADAARLADILLSGSITFWNSAPAYMQFLLPSLRSRIAAEPPEVRHVFLSGDWVSVSLVGEVRESLRVAQLVALGGATEATIWSNYFVVPEIDPRWSNIPYGKPIQNARYYILDERRRPCATGQKGHLYIGGECLSAGYLHAEELTSQKFVPDPFHERQGMTMYATGDLARVGSDGNIEFLGRMDNQVKLRGFRIELAEIETALTKAGLESAVAVVREEKAGNPFIAAFGVSHDDEGFITDDAFWQRLRDQLPEYMIPSRVCVLKTLPTTDNGKVDRKRLSQESWMELLAHATQKPHALDIANTSGPGRACLVKLLCSTLGNLLSLDPTKFDGSTDLAALGANSLHFAVLAERLGEAMGRPVNPATLFHCATIDALIQAVSDPSLTRSVAPGVIAADLDAARTPADRLTELSIIGIHCRMPHSDGLDAFWTNIVASHDCIDPIPPDRWDWKTHYGDPNGEGNVTSAHCAGFIRDIDCFDAAFFAISPREAELMDPRQRLLLEGVWKTLEDAGYRPTSLRGQPIGVFVGALGDEYAALLQQKGGALDRFSLTGSARSFLANRVSYYFGWHGPSEVIDTTCSSSLVAVHNAARAIQNGDCSMAIVAGINVMIDPIPHISLSKVGVLSADGACKTFDTSANGYVRGEGLGIVLLKSLADAEADKDHIYAAVCGTAVNHGGRASALTAPNAGAQARVIVEAHRRSGLHPRQIGYIEAHGTGTPLGDPIEIEGIKEALTTLYGDRREALPSEKHVSVGSVKTSIGHLEGAAGIAGLLKAVAALRYRQLPPTRHLTKLNPRIEINGTPLFFHTDARPWSAHLDASGRRLLRAAGVSAFGFGGVNAHVVVREHEFLLKETGLGTAARSIIPLSAETKQQLADYARALSAALTTVDGARIHDVAYTLAVGRESFSQRAAFVTNSIQELVRQLTAFACGDHAIPDVCIGSGLEDADRASAAPSIYAPSVPHQTDPTAVAQAWVRGHTIDWRMLYADMNYRRISLPTYPFARTRYWHPALRPQAEDRSRALLVESSTSSGRAFRLYLARNERFVADHTINSTPVLAASAYAALSDAVGRRILDSDTLAIADVVWSRPLRFTDDEPKPIDITVSPHGDGHLLSFQASSNGEQVELCSARLDGAPPRRRERVDIDIIKARCGVQLSGTACYRRLHDAGLRFGPSLRVIQSVWCGPYEAIARLAIEDSDLAVAWQWAERLNPALLDGAFQLSVLHELLNSDGCAPASLALPFSAKRITPYSALPSQCYAFVLLDKTSRTASSVRKCEITLLSDVGEPLVHIEQSTGRPQKRRESAQYARVYRESWQRVAAPLPRKDGAAITRHLFVGLPALADAFSRAGHGVLANAILAKKSTASMSYGAAVPWPSLLRQFDGVTPGRLVVWYDSVGLMSLPANDQVCFSFDTMFELSKQLLALRLRKPCFVIISSVSAAGRDESPTVGALSGFARAVRSENPLLRLKLVQWVGLSEAELVGRCKELTYIVDGLCAWAPDATEHRIDLRTSAYEVKRLTADYSPCLSQGLHVRPGGVYVVTGGGGGIGQRIARRLVECGAKVALIGRSAEPQTAVVEPSLSAAARYLQADVTDAVAIAKGLTTVRAELGPIRGVFHCAGVAGGQLLLHRPLSAARHVLAPKVLGTINLDEATRNDPLDYFVLFSSLASVTGPVGASDYAYANRYGDLFSEHRNAMIRSGQRQGVTVSVSWPPWSDGGMSLPPREIDHLRSMGLTPIGSNKAIEVLAACLAAGGGHFIVGCGNGADIERFFSTSISPMTTHEQEARS